jgi:hypothetical protein
MQSMKVYLAAWPTAKNSATTIGDIGEAMKVYLATMNPERQGSSSINHVGEAMKVYLVASEGRNARNNHSLYSLAEGATHYPLRVLCSYYYFKGTPIDEALAESFPGQPIDLFFDSGAFSAWSQGNPVNLGEYAAWLHKYEQLFTVYANLDVIQNAEATWQNQQWLERDGLKPLPVFHVAEDWRYLDRYLERYPYIALGIGGQNPRALMPWLVQCFKRAKGRAVYHGFGIMAWEVLKAFPWYSIDSSSWGQGFRFGHVPLFDSQRGRFFKVQLGDHASCYAYVALLRSMGFDAADFADRSRNDRKKICALSVLSYIKAEQWLQQRWGPVSIPGRPEQQGFKLYFAETQEDFNDVRNVVPFLEQGEA